MQHKIEWVWVHLCTSLGRFRQEAVGIADESTEFGVEGNVGGGDVIVSNSTISLSSPRAPLSLEVAIVVFVFVFALALALALASAFVAVTVAAVLRENCGALLLKCVGFGLCIVSLVW